ncbi:MAG: PEP/pyruvate-binding domain-containing protein, partial [Bacteroidota bacterium]
MTETVPLLADPADPDPRVWGGKGAALARLGALGLPVLPVAALTPDAFWASLPEAQALALRDAAGPKAAAEALADLSLSPDVEAALADALDRLGEADFYAVRSSAPGEDGAADAFAGQLETFLFVPRGEVAHRVADVWRSAFAARVWAYREARGLVGPPEAPAVVLQPMLDPEAAGVAFSAEPVSGDRGVAVVAAVRGLGSALVDGRADAETLHIDASGTVTRRETPPQRVADRLGPGGGVEEVAVDGVAPVLTDAQAASVAALARNAEATFDAPQDIEWAIAEGRLWLLQSRPVTTLVEPEVSGRTRLWDNANIVESYAGVTTPMTYSFARRAYEAVYREFCRLLRVPEARIEAESDTFAQMIGFVHGRIYYNLGSWYRVLALLPGYRLNAGLMEGMMGVKDGIPEALRPEPPSTGRLGDALALGRTLLGLVSAHWRLPRMKVAFLDRVEGALGTHGARLDDLSLDELAEVYAALEGELLRKWDAPLVNDFFAMVWFGLAGRAADAWIGPGALGGLLAGDGDVVSAEPARRVRALAEQAAPEPAFVDRLSTGSPADIEADLRARPAFAADLAAYLDRFGDRCLEELKLESATLTDDPTPLYRSIGATAQRLRDGADLDADARRADATRTEAESRAASALRGHPVRRLAFGWLLKQARARVRDRENLRFERTRVFGRARRLILAMGQRLAEADRLAFPREVFWLRIDELEGAIRGTGVNDDLQALADTRSEEFEYYTEDPTPPDRFTTRGAVATSDLVPALPEADDLDGDVRSGLGCCAGVVEG